MAAIVEERTIEAAPDKVFSALTQQDEIAHWWTDDLSVKPEVGTLAEFRFRQGAFVIQLEIAELDQDEKVYWILRQGAPHWAGTSVTWQLEPVHNRTKVVFSHDGFAQADEPYEATRRTWQYFLDSLKSYLETGKGTPGFPRFM
jgi:uncharacterized protein YndB with AHSA1/START domain